MAQNVVIKLSGLATYPNLLSEVQPGNLIKATNVVCNRDSTIEPRRGFKLYGSSFGISTDRVKQLLSYKERILRHYGTTLQFDNGSGTFTSFTGSYSSPSSYRIRGIEANGNFYFTDTTGVKKISASSAANLSASSISSAGMYKALEVILSTTAGNFLPNNYIVAYRVVWGFKDSNNNLILGAPSDNISIENTSGSAKSVNLQFTIPSGITTSHFYQIYRTATVPNTSEPGDECALVYEANPTSSEITAAYINVNDDITDDFRGANLYTNPNSGEGILQANNEPPKCKDIASYKSYTFFANTETKHRKQLSLLSIVDIPFRTGSISSNTAANPTIITTSSSHQLETGRKIKITGSNSTPSIDGVHTITKLSSTTFSIPVNVTVAGTSGTWDTYETFVISDGTTTETYVGSDTGVPANKTYVLSTAATPGLQIEETVNNLIYTINSQSSGLVYAYKLSGTGDLPGTILFESRTLGSNPFYFYTNSDLFGPEWQPALPTSGNSIISDNEVSPNRIYYSKYSQPEAVPIVNYFDVGPKDKDILRILALRDSLFVFKEEGVYRVSGESAPFSVALFDSSTLLTAIDTAVVLNNEIYMLSDQGVAKVSDTGVSIISRAIEGSLLKLNTTQYTNYATASFGVSYESDRSYYLFTVENTSDTVATQCWRYNTFSNAWTKSPLSKTCGIVGFADDLLYLGPSDTNYIEQERKTFTRTDYADREYNLTLASNSINGTEITFPSTTNVDEYDAMVQVQYLTIYQLNKLLKKLDDDTGVADSNYFSLLGATPGDNLRDILTNLASKLDADPGVTDTNYGTTISGYTTSFTDTQLAFNAIVNKLNTDSGVTYLNYETSTGTTTYEVVLNSVNKSTNKATVDFEYPFIAGTCTVYKKIACEIQLVPQSMGDVSLLKQVSEATMLFEKKDFTKASMGFASDLSPGFDLITFNLSGSGTFGNAVFGEDTFGGSSNSGPFRTLVPRGKQRCRYINISFKHGTAREYFNLYGISLTFNPTSTRAYR